MRRIDTPNRAVDLFGAGKDGFKAAVPGVAPATELSATWFNAVQEAIVRTIEAAGLALSDADLDQFTAAVQAIAGAAAGSRVTQGGGAGQIAGLVKIGAAAGGKLKGEVAGVDLGNFAFESWVTAQIAGMAGTAPDLLNTIQELADAIADDPNFAVTMTNALAGKERKFDSGTRMLFQQTAAPVGWTKVTTYDNQALRVVSGAAGTGGSHPFTSVFTAGLATSNTALTVGMINGGAVPQDLAVFVTGGSLPDSHSHNVDLNVQYVDVIIASKD